jgi:lipopolysaccharide biosynthesis glycosyltransferase
MIHIFLSADENYIQHLGVTITSILMNARPDTRLHFHILESFVSRESKTRIDNLAKLRDCNISFISVDTGIFSELPLKRHISATTYNRLLIPNLAPDLEKVLYLDCDIIVRTDLSELWEIPLGDKAAAVIEDAGVSVEVLAPFGINQAGRYFNSGVMLMNLEKMRRMAYSEIMIDFILKNSELMSYLDQDAANATLLEDVIYVHPRWNQQYGMYIYKLNRTAYPDDWYEEAIMDPAIVHFTTALKPWFYKSRHKFKHEYWQYLKMTDWKDYKVPDFNLLNFYRKNMPPALRKLVSAIRH